MNEMGAVCSRSPDEEVPVVLSGHPMRRGSRGHESEPARTQRIEEP